MKIRNLLLLSALLSCSVPAFAADDAEPSKDPVTVTIDTTTGSFTAGSGNYRSQWTSTATPGVVLDCGVNNFYNASSGDLQYGVGKSGSSTITVSSKGDDYFVSAITFEAKVESATSNVNVHINSQANVKLTDEYQTFTATMEEGAGDMEIHASGDNVHVFFHNFTVTLSPVTVQAVYEPLTTTIVNGEFAEGTPWFNLQLSKNMLSLYNNGEQQMTALNTHSDYQAGEDHQWCFVAQPDGTYKIYNREAGVGKVLAAPANASDYPRMMAEGNAEYCYTWNLKPAKVTSSGANIDSYFDGKFPFYLSLSSNANAIVNNFAGQNALAFWTAGYDNGSVIVPVLVEGVFHVDLDHGYLTREGVVDTSNRWQGYWNLTGNFGMKFGPGKNNMTTTTGDVLTGDLQLASGQVSSGYSFVFPHTDYYVAALSFTTRGSSEQADVTLGVGAESIKLTGTTPHEVELTDLTHNSVIGISVNAENDPNHNAVISNMVVSVKRYARVFLEPTFVFKRSDASCERRIPALAVTGKSGVLIAAYDLRNNGGDLGSAKNIDIQIAISKDHGATWSDPDFAYSADGTAVTHFNTRWKRNELSTIPDEDFAAVFEFFKAKTFTDDNKTAIAAKNLADLTQAEKQTVLNDSHVAWIQTVADQAWDSAWGDAAIVGDRESDEVMMVAVGGPTGFWGSSREARQSGILWRSKDAGETWEGPINITDKIYTLFDGEPRNGKIDGFFFGSGRMCQSRHVKVGKYYRVYTAISSNNLPNQQTRNFVLYTDDFGDTWHVLGGNATWPTAGNADEPKVEELPDGTVMLAARGKGGNRNFAFFRYTNPTTGEGHWGNAINTNMGMGGINACNGEIYILPVRNLETQKNGFLALQSFPYGGSRKMVSIAYKPLFAAEDFDAVEDFQSWEGRYQVCGDGHESTYSTMVLTHDYNIGFFYEENLTGSLDGVYKKIPLTTITEGKYEYVPDNGNTIAQELTTALAEYRMENIPNDADYASEMDEACLNYLGEPSWAAYVAINRAEYGFTGTSDDYDFNYAAPIWPGVEVNVELEAITATPATISIAVDETATITVTGTPAEVELGTITWSSSDETVATVANGVVTGVKEGTATITATVGNLTATCAVTVTAKSGIDEVTAAEGATVIYDLMGRKVVAPSRGLYIVNGKKALVK